MGVWIGNVVYDLPWGNDLKGHAHEIRAVATLYSELLGLRNESRADMHREFDYEGGDECDEIDPLLRSREPGGIGLAFEYDKRGLNRMPRWPDPGYPQQVHIDVFVDDLDAAEGRVVKLGAVKLRDAETHRTYMDQVGHPFCLYVHEAGGWPGVLGRGSARAAGSTRRTTHLTSWLLRIRCRGLGRMRTSLPKRSNSG